MPLTSIALLGAGVHANSHLPYMLEQGIETIYYFDPKIELQLPSHIKTIRCQTIDELFERTPGIPVYITSPDQFHLTQIQRSILEKRNIFSEKPLLNNRKEIDDLLDGIANARINDLAITSCHPRRFDPPFSKVLKNIVQNRSPFTKDLGAIKKLLINFDYKPPKPELPIDSMMMDKLNHDIDVLNFLFPVRSIELHKRYDSPRAFSVEGNLSTEDGQEIQLGFGGGRYAQDGYQEWIQIYFEEGYVLINPIQNTPDNKANAELIVINNKTQTAQYHLAEGLGTDYEGRVSGATKAALEQLDNKTGYLTDIDLLFNNVLPATLQSAWPAHSEQNNAIEKYFEQLQSEQPMSLCLTEVIKAAKTLNYAVTLAARNKAEQTQLNYYQSACERLKMLKISTDSSATLNKEQLAAKMEQLVLLGKASKTLTEEYMLATSKSAGVLPYYTGADGSLYFGVVETEIKHGDLSEGIFDLAAGGEDVRVTHSKTKQPYTLDMRKPHLIPEQLRLAEVLIPLSQNTTPVTQYAHFDLQDKKNRLFFEDNAKPELSIEHRKSLFQQLFNYLPRHGWSINAIETDIVAAANECREEHGFNLEPTAEHQKNSLKITLSLPSLRGTYVTDIEHVWYAVHVPQSEVQSVQLNKTTKEKGHWISLEALDAHYEQWLEHAKTMMGTDFNDRINRLIIMANLHKYVGVILAVAGQGELRDKWLCRLPELKEHLAQAFYQNYMYENLISRMRELKLTDISPREWETLAVLGRRPVELTKEAIDHITATESQMTQTLSQMGIFAQDRLPLNKPEDATQTPTNGF